MALHLVYSRHYLGGFEETLGLGDGEVGDTNSPHKPVAHKLFHALLYSYRLRISGHINKKNKKKSKKQKKYVMKQEL